MQGRLLSKDARFFDLLRSLPGQLRGCRGGLHQSKLKERFFELRDMRGADQLV